MLYFTEAYIISKIMDFTAFYDQMMSSWRGTRGDNKYRLEIKPG